MSRVAPNPESCPAEHPGSAWRQPRHRAPRAGQLLRRASLLAVAAVGAFALGACSSIRLGDIEPPPGERVIVEIDIVGNDNVATSDIVSELRIQPQGLDVPAKDSPVDMAEISTDARRVEAIYAAYGYFRAHVTDYWVDDLANHTARVVFRVEEGPPTLVNAIHFVGLNPGAEIDVEAAKRLDDLESKLPDLLTLKPGEIWEESKYEEGLSLIANAFRDVGFVSVRVEGQSYVSRDRNEAGVYYRIAPGPLTRIGEIRVVGTQSFPKERILRRTSLRLNDIISSEDLRETEAQIYDLGVYFSVTARPIKIDETGGVEPLGPTGPPVGTGGAATKAEPGAAAPTAAPGDTSPTAQTAGSPSQGDVPGVEVASSDSEVVASDGDAKAPEPGETPGEAPPPATPPEAPLPDEDEPPPDGGDDEDPGGGRRAAGGVRAAAPLPLTVPIEISVQEMPLWDVSIGFAAATDSIKATFSVPLSYQNRSFFGDIIGLTLKADPAIVIPDVTQSWSAYDFGFKGLAQVDWPSFLEEYLRLLFQTKYERDPSQDVKSDAVTGSLAFSRQLATWLTARVGYNVSYFRFYGTDALSEARDEALAVADLRFKREDLLTFIDVGAVVDFRDGLYDARSGWYFSANADFASTALGGDADYIHLLGDLRVYVKVAQWLSIAMRARGGINFYPQGQGTPIAARFKSGGPSTFRGVAAGRLGDYICGEPQDLGGGATSSVNVSCGDGSTDRTYIGGNYLAEGNIELRFYLTDLLGFVAFADVARLWSLESQIDFADPYIAVGPGLRLFTPVGPVRADLGILIRGPGAPVPQFHLSLGQAF